MQLLEVTLNAQLQIYTITRIQKHLEDINNNTNQSFQQTLLIHHY